MITIEKFVDADTKDVIELVLHFQNDGTRPAVSVEDQPDLLHITEEYINTGGFFWVAKDNGKFAGSIGLMPASGKIALLKKFFVYEKYQGAPHHLGQKLYGELHHFAKQRDFQILLLDTPKNTHRAHKFYKMAGFEKIEEKDLPVAFSHPYEDCDFFLLRL